MSNAIYAITFTAREQAELLPVSDETLEPSRHEIAGRSL